MPLLQSAVETGLTSKAKMKNLIDLILFLALSFVFTQTGVALLEKLFGGGQSGERPLADLVPQNACIVAAVFPEQITSNEALKLFQHEIMTRGRRHRVTDFDASGVWATIRTVAELD